MQIRAFPLILAALIVLSGIILTPPTIEAATPPQPTRCDAFFISNVTSSGDAWVDYQPGDTLMVNASGVFTFNTSVAGAGSGAITVNAGGILIINAGVSLEIATATAITINEGGEMRCLGTSGSRVTIVGNDKTSATHYIQCEGGKMYFQHTDITLFYKVSTYRAGILEMVNCTVSDCSNPIDSNTYAGGAVTLINTTINANTANKYVLSTGGYNCNIIAVNCIFLSTTANYMGWTTYTFKASFYGCIYNGVPISSASFGYTSMDIDLRIYEASTV
ncbi:MAG: hypothetical protein PHT77_13145, partial [Bacteroidales bacterium]|nr:hypothetical protein [Bacteroidales bacterium]